MTMDDTTGGVVAENTGNTLAARLWGELPIYIFAVLGFAGCIMVWRAHGIYFHPGSLWQNFQLFAGFVIFLGAPVMMYRLFRTKPDSPISWFVEQIRSPEWRRIVIPSLPMLVMCIALIPAFSTFKSMIPRFTQFTWDATFIAWDRALFFGHDAWQVLQPVLGYPIVTALIAVIYHLWLMLLYAGVLYMAWSAWVPVATRRAFFLTYAMSWAVIGGIMATLFASVGPAFVEPILGMKGFAAQTDYLHAANEVIPVMVVPVQQLLVDGYFSSDGGLGKGISAMPSMHVAICVLYWLAGREISPAHGRFFFWFMVVIWIGSVHTAYHYAVDGLVSFAAVGALWWLAKLVFAAWDRVPSPVSQPTLRTNTVPAE